jgi:hypothetical protein
MPLFFVFNLTAVERLPDRGPVRSELPQRHVTTRTEPANLNAAVAYKINGLQIAGSFVYCFNQFAMWNGKEKGYTGRYDLGIGLDYTFNAFPLDIGEGYLFNNSGARPGGRDQLREELNANNVSAGLPSSTRKLVLTLF